MKNNIMRTISFSVLLVSLLFFISCVQKTDKGSLRIPKAEVNNDLKAGKISVVATEESFDLLAAISNDYLIKNTNISIELLSASFLEAKDMLLSGKVQIAVVGSTENPLPEVKSALIATDLIVPIVNFNNPSLQTLVLRGIDMTQLKEIFVSNKIINWKQIRKIAEPLPVKPIVGPDSSSINIIVQNFLKSKFNISVSSTISEKDIVDAVLASAGSIAFVSNRSAYSANSSLKISGIYIIPYDANGNDLADDDELIYDDAKTLKRAYERNVFPKELVRNHYFLMSNNAERADIANHFMNFAKNKSANSINSARYFETLK